MKSPSHFLNSHRDKSIESSEDFNFGVQINTNKNLRSNRFKSQIVLNNDVEKANYIDKNKLRKSLTEMKDAMNDNEDGSKSPEVKEYMHRSLSPEKESIQDISSNSNKITKSIFDNSQSPLTNLKAKKLKKYTLNNQNNQSGDSKVSKKRQSIISLNKESILSTDNMFTTKKSKEMYERNKFLRQKLEQNLKIRHGERLSSNESKLNESKLSQRSNLRNVSTSSIESSNNNFKFKKNNNNLSSDSLKIKSLTKNTYMNVIKDEDEFNPENRSSILENNTQDQNEVSVIRNGNRTTIHNVHSDVKNEYEYE